MKIEELLDCSIYAITQLLDYLRAEIDTTEESRKMTVDLINQMSEMCDLSDYLASNPCVTNELNEIITRIHSQMEREYDDYTDG